MSRSTVACLVVALVVLGTGCGQRSASNSGGGVVMPIVDDDPQMSAAETHARETVGTFLTALKNPTPGQTGFQFKMRLVDPSKPEEGEAIWLSQPTFDGANLHGVIADGDQPEHVLVAHVGDHLSETPGNIIDWSFQDGGKPRGGYTTRVMYLEATPEEQTQLRKETGYTDAELRATD